MGIFNGIVGTIKNFGSNPLGTLSSIYKGSVYGSLHFVPVIGSALYVRDY